MEDEKKAGDNNMEEEQEKQNTQEDIEDTAIQEYPEEILDDNIDKELHTTTPTLAPDPVPVPAPGVSGIKRKRDDDDDIVVIISDTDTSDSDKDSNDDDNDSDICHVDSYQATPAEAKRIRTGGYSDSGSDSTDVSSMHDLEEEEEDSAAISVLNTPVSDLSKEAKKASPRVENLSKITLNKKLEDLKDSVKQHWENKEKFSDSGVSIDTEPYRTCVINDFLNETEVVNNLLDNMNTLDWYRFTMDLYEFHRTDDLSRLTWQRGIKAMQELLQDDVMKWVAEVTGLNLTRVSATCALYGPGDHLLVHDDLMGDRRVAFIFYLTPWDILYNTFGSNVTKTVPDADKQENGSETDENPKENGWNASMGGVLQFFAIDNCGKPTVAVKSLVPKNNTFTFFKVGKETFHKVSEVTTYDYPRLTINGWFHGPQEESNEDPAKSETSETAVVSYKELGMPPNVDMLQTTLSRWIVSNYLTPRTKYKVQEQMEQSSEISLPDFFIWSQYKSLTDCLKTEGLPWKPHGPANLRQYQILDIDKLSEENIITEIHKMLSTEHFIKLIGEFTGLSLKTFHSLEIQKWSSGSYQVIPLKEEYDVTELDLILYFGLPSRHFTGGSVVYLVPEEDNIDPLITVEPTSNALNLVYSDEGTSKFTKYVSELSLSKDECFYIAACTYRE